MERCDFDEMCERLATYIEEQGNAQVPKKFKPDPELGGWVAAVRRTQGNGLDAARRARLDARPGDHTLAEVRPPLDGTQLATKRRAAQGETAAQRSERSGA